MIYLKLAGRIGNQLFMYAAAKMIQKLQGEDQVIVIDETLNRSLNYENSLINYPLENVFFVNNTNSKLKITYRMRMLLLADKILEQIEKRKSLRERHEFEVKYQKIWNKIGLLKIQDGYIQYPSKITNDIVLDGYFQSEKYFKPISNEIKELYSLKEEVENSGYPGLEMIRSRNTVCISIKVQHNVGNPMYDVCNLGYYEKAIDLICQKVDKPFFFICSDDVEYVKTYLIDTTKYDYVTQASEFPVHISLAVMAQCKHFIIGNTSFGWWAQYLSQYPDKIVIAPSRWYGIDVPCDIYQDNWELIEV